MPSGAGARPYGMAVDGDERIWFVETGVQPNRFVGFDPASERFFAASDIPSGGGSVRHMHYHEPTDTIWFGADSGTIGRAKLD
jgi:virginiamycin B lyase